MRERLLPIVNALAPVCNILLKPFSINMDLVAKYAVIWGSVFSGVGLFLKHKVSVPSTAAPLAVWSHLIHRNVPKVKMGWKICRWKPAGERCKRRGSARARRKRSRMQGGKTSGWKRVGSGHSRAAAALLEITVTCGSQSGNKRPSALFLQVALAQQQRQGYKETMAMHFATSHSLSLPYNPLKIAFTLVRWQWHN